METLGRTVFCPFFTHNLRSLMETVGRLSSAPTYPGTVRFYSRQVLLVAKTLIVRLEFARMRVNPGLCRLPVFKIITHSPDWGKETWQEKARYFIKLNSKWKYEQTKKAGNLTLSNISINNRLPIFHNFLP